MFIAIVIRILVANSYEDIMYIYPYFFNHELLGVNTVHTLVSCRGSPIGLLIFAQADSAKLSRHLSSL